MADETVFKPGLEGVIAFETDIAEPDKEGSALRYRGVDIERPRRPGQLRQRLGLLVDGRFAPGLPPAEQFQCRSTPATSGSTCRAHSRPSLRRGGCSNCSTSTNEQARDDLARCSVTAMSFVAQSARGLGSRWCRRSASTSARRSSSGS